MTFSDGKKRAWSFKKCVCNRVVNSIESPNGMLSTRKRNTEENYLLGSNAM
jgi:hypothetical protein